jgi:hypothetical protein
MNATTSVSLPMQCASPRLNRRLIARQAQTSFERSSQSTRVARGSRISKLASAKLPSLIHSSRAMHLLEQASENGDVLPVPMPLPHFIETDDRRAGAFGEPPGQSSFSAPGATQDDDSHHNPWRNRCSTWARLPSKTFPPAVP